MSLSNAQDHLVRARQRANTAAAACIELSALAAHPTRMISLRSVLSTARQLAAAAIAAAETAARTLPLLAATNDAAAEELAQSAAHTAELAASAIQSTAEAAQLATQETSS